MKEMSVPDGLLGEALQRNCEAVIALFVDERSLVGCNTLGWMEFNSRCGMNNVSNFSELWGGIPLVFIGDDVQLPPIHPSHVNHR